MKGSRWWSLGLLAALAAAPLAAQKPDYLTEEEVLQVRDTQEPSARIKLFLGFAEQRLVTLEKALAAPGQEAAGVDDLRDRLNNFINAVDDTATSLEVPLKRGGVDLHKTRPLLAKDCEGFLTRLEAVQKNPVAQGEDLRYDVEDATIAVQELLAMSKTIPEEPIPLKEPVAVSADPDEKPAPAGKPSLKRRQEKEKEKPPKPPR